jgi:hypothetical protein
MHVGAGTVTDYEPKHRCALQSCNAAQAIHDLQFRRAIRSRISLTIDSIVCVGE